LEGLDQLELSRPIATVQDADVDDMIEKLRNQKKIWTMVDRPAQEHDRLAICFSGICEGVNFTDGKVENYQLEIGSKQMIPDFEENLIGLMAGDNKVFELTFPEKHSNQELAGKLVEFDVEVISIEEPVLPEIDDTFIQAYGIEGSLDTFREDIRSNLESELKLALHDKLKNVVTSALYEKIKFTVPVILVNQEIKALMEPYVETAKRQKLKLDDLKLSKELFEETAKRRVAVGLILTEIIQKNTFKVDDTKVRSLIEDMAKNYERPIDVINWYFSDENRLDDVRQVVLENQTIDWLIDKAKVTDVTIKFSEAMNKQSQGVFNV
jgi:trigger factor